MTRADAQTALTDWLSRKLTPGVDFFSTSVILCTDPNSVLPLVLQYLKSTENQVTIATSESVHVTTTQATQTTESQLIIWEVAASEFVKHLNWLVNFQYQTNMRADAQLLNVSKNLLILLKAESVDDIPYSDIKKVTSQLYNHDLD